MKQKISVLKIIVIAVAVILIIATAGALMTNYAFVGGKPVNLSASEFDFSGSGNVSAATVLRLKNPESINLKGCDISVDDYNRITEEFPDCRILWSVPLGNAKFDSDSTSITLSDSAGITAEQISALKCAENLTTFDAAGLAFDTECLYALGQLAKEMPECDFNWDIQIAGQTFPSDTAELVLSADVSESDMDLISCFTALEVVDVTAVPAATFSAYADKLAESGIAWRVSMLGKDFLSTEAEIDMSGIKVTDLEAFAEQLVKLPTLKKLDMCDCGLSNEQMEVLLERYPEIKFVWYISFGRWTNIRTDITCFSSLNHSQQPYNEDTYAPLFKYCTDLVALDLGHSSIKDITLISNLTKLQALILGDNFIKDISPLESLQDLEYLEIWTNSFRDISVLSKLPNLKDLNMTYCKNVTNFEPLFDLPSIEKIWIQGCYPGASVTKRLKETYPDCIFSFYAAPGAAHSNGWCSHDRYKGIRQAFVNWKYVVNYTTWDNVEYQEGVKIRIIK